MKNRTIYQPPVEKLLTLSDYHKITNEYNYIAELGLDTEHIPELIRMAVDKRLNGVNSGSLEVWGQIHAWRALGQLRAEVAIEPLMQLFHELEDSDWVNEEMPKAYGMFGEIAIPRLQAYLADESHGIFPRITAIHCLEEICKQHPHARQKCITVITQQLKLFAQNPQELNGFLVASLIELQAVESATIIKSAFVGQSVPDEITGSWDDVCKILGINSDEIVVFTDIGLDGVSQIDNLSTDDLTQTENIAVSEESQIEDTSADDLMQTENTSQTENIAVSEEFQIEDTSADDLTQTENISQTENIAISEESQIEDTSVDDVTQTENIAVSEEFQIEDTSTDDVTQTENISQTHQTQDIAVNEKQSETVNTEESEKNLDIISDDIQLIEDVNTDVEKLQKVEHKLEGQKQKNDTNNRETEVNQFKSELDNTVVTESVEQPSSKGFGGFATSQGKAKSKKKKKR
ncbi:hypothetical protein NIES4106_40630 [Fischerella sp. NIES-4106]|nr:hypothetical protein NIES4106_40630 [Fischerella sp. NIES-4106]